MKKKYLVSYFYSKKHDTGFGDIIITLDENLDIYTEEGISKVRQFIINKCKADGCSIQNIISLNS